MGQRSNCTVNTTLECSFFGFQDGLVIKIRLICEINNKLRRNESQKIIKYPLILTRLIDSSFFLSSVHIVKKKKIIYQLVQNNISFFFVKKKEIWYVCMHVMYLRYHITVLRSECEMLYQYDIFAYVLFNYKKNLRE